MRTTEPAGTRGQALARLLVGLLGAGLLASCSMPTTGSTSSEPVVSWLGPDRIAASGAEPVALDDALPGPPLLAVPVDADALALRVDGLDRVDDGGVTTAVLDWETPVLGGEVVYGDDDVVLSAVSTGLGDLEEATQVLRLHDGEVTTLLDTPGNVPLVGVLPEGVVVRDGLGQSRLSLLGWDATMVGLGVEASDAVLVPRSSLLLVADEDGTVRALDVDEGAEVTIEGWPDGAVLVQAATSPVGDRVAVGLRAGDDTALWVVQADPRVARRLGALAANDVVAGFTDDGQWVVVLRDGDQPQAVHVDDGRTAEVAFPDDATPIGWSRPSLTLQSRWPS